MSWILARVLALAGVSVLGALLGHAAGRDAASAALGAALAAGALSVLLSLDDVLRAQRLMRWLSRPDDGAPPALGGCWAELAYRAHRALRAEQRAVQEERSRLVQFLSAIEASPNGVLLVDAAERIQWCNPTAAQHFGLDRARDMHQRITNLVRAPAFVQHLHAGDLENSVVFPNLRAQGVLAVTVREYGDGMRLIISQDVTERERADRMRSDFVANVSHEIRSPLTVLSGFVETLIALPLGRDERQHVLGLMEQQTTRMRNLVTDLLALAQIEGAPQPPADRWVNVGELMTQVETAAHALSRGQHALHFEQRVEAELSGSESELLSAVWNLVGNALRYTPAGGTVQVVWRVTSAGAGEFIVADTGIGIPAEHLPRLTERFYRVDGSRSRETGGTGLGLAIVKHVVQRHGGELTARSEVGKGSVFAVVLPSHRVRVLPCPGSRAPHCMHDAADVA